MQRQKLKMLTETKEKWKQVKRQVLLEKRINSNSRTKQSGNSEEEKETFCLVGEDKFSNSESKEPWLQCTRCKYWSHEKCTDFIYGTNVIQMTIYKHFFLFVVVILLYCCNYQFITFFFLLKTNFYIGHLINQ